MNKLSTDAYRDAVSNFPTGLVVVTAQAEGELLGFTCQTFGSLSLEPARVLFAAGNQGTTWPKMKKITSVAISILADNQEQVARSMANSGGQKFDEVETIEGENGAPLVVGALAHLEGEIERIENYGDHDIVSVEVTRASFVSGSPLIYAQRGYRLLK
jgi:3-hydroxy-9,10-secoandrosta-1,3,5(10)-triene-9,17-dione monooxygenase reductase component